MDDQTIELVIAGLRSVSDALILDKRWLDVARAIDRACAFMEMNDAAKARSELDKAIGGLPTLADGSPRFPEHVKLVQDARDALPKGDLVNPRVSKKLMRIEDGFTFEQCIGEPESTVIIPVPEETKPEDVWVEFRVSHLVVRVRGHEKQPAVIDGPLSQPIALDGCAWSLTSEGPQRVLYVAIEKKAPEFVWSSFFKEAGPMR
ncbi:hypothetical protein CTAYLR_005138 [Chrysophaeum taylorii]|uniref:CS domain-containing protein n=1 Tax=Chrysophaeum taylorii TaxID=2483200 RepID=A0AAD7UDY9_9STRA|nr:hypothetical protein CTAYLR_005138 [Chrysophaeum taylorii]